MARFTKCGVYHLNPGEKNGRDLAPSKASQWILTRSPSNDDSASPLSSTRTDNALEEGYDIHDEQYISWLCANHLDAIPPQFANGASVI